MHKNDTSIKATVSDTQAFKQMSSKAKRVPKHLFRFTTFMTTFPAVHSSRDQ